MEKDIRKLEVEIEGAINGSQKGEACGNCRYWDNCSILKDGHWCLKKTSKATEYLAKNLYEAGYRLLSTK